ncbi:MAG: hypothetical protein QM487_00880 [Candidatus Marithrix sp.]
MKELANDIESLKAEVAWSFGTVEIVTNHQVITDKTTSPGIPKDIKRLRGGKMAKL